MSEHQSPDISGSKLNEQRFHILEQIAQEMGGNIVFPVCFEITAKISLVMRSKAPTIQKIAVEIQKDPLVTSKILKLANSVTYNPGGANVTDLNQALMRIGMQATRSLALACAMEQMSQSKAVSPFEAFSREILLHSLKASMVARVLAQKLAPHLHADSAMLAGLVHDLGAFYILHHAVRYPELVERPDSVKYLVAQWHESIGVILLDALGLPEEVVESAADHDFPRTTPVEHLRSLADVVYVANLWADGLNEVQKLDAPGTAIEPPELTNPKYVALQPEFEAAVADFMSTW
ncbi:HDOD domain-containing protein [Silvimonas iriomotensis]|uniref:HDOD domain-containing protein n=1 Tax=Silvimonas iriomotensis TaxID=449662 RepID=A0ABQ2P7U8_9NEIS|nr:HDOD domain-containing protein [Silvimonas iriomotensis]GGP19951.1 hypothetical protein GCM10010970_13160 [Silvimonas iriomotensis]